MLSGERFVGVCGYHKVGYSQIEIYNLHVSYMFGITTEISEEGK